MDKDNPAELVKAAKDVTRRRVSVLTPHRDWILVGLAAGASLNAIRIVLKERFDISISRQTLHKWVRRQLSGEQGGGQSEVKAGTVDVTMAGQVDEVPATQTAPAIDAGKKGDVDKMVKQIYEFMKIEPLNKE